MAHEKVKRILVRGTSSPTESLNLFIGIGAQRSGTTWLSRYLDHHPDFMISSIKELHIFDSLCLRVSGAIEEKFAQALIETSHNDLNKQHSIKKFQTLADRVALPHIQGGYYRFFEKRITSSHKAFGEITPEYALLDEEVFTTINQSHPRCKFFYIMRDPAKRYISALNYWGRCRPNFSVKDNILAGLRKELFTKYSYYQETIRKLLKTIPREQILFMFYEDLFSTPNKSIKELCSFLEIDFYSSDQLGVPSGKKVNKSTADKYVFASAEELQQIRKHFEKVYSEVPKLLDARTPRGWRLEIT